MHQSSKRGTWCKVHLAIDPVSQEILATELTSSKVGDSTYLPKLLKTIKDHIKTLWADGAYDKGPVYQHHIEPIIPPRQGAQASYSFYTRKRLGKRRLISQRTLA